MKSRVIVSALISDGDKCLFIKQNKTDGAYPNTLHIPGGGLEPGENPEEGIRREIREEVSIEIKNLKPFDFDWGILQYKKEPTLLIFLRFIGTLDSGQARPLSDAKEILWIPKKSLSKQIHNPPTRRMLKKLGLL